MANVKDGDVRVFPYVGDIYLGVEKTGYSNKKSAMKFMNRRGVLDPDFVYAHFGGKEKYIREHSTFQSLEKTVNIVNPGSYWERKEVKSVWKKGSELSDEEYNTLIDLYRKYDACYHGTYIVDPVKEKEYRKMIEDLGYEPDTLYYIVSHSAYRDYEEDYVMENVEFREGIVHLNVEFTGNLK